MVKVNLGGCSSFVKDADYKANVEKALAALEVLAVVAYNQPVTKAFIEQVRGVDCSGRGE